MENCINGNDSHFPIQNIPFGVFKEGIRSPRCCTRIGDTVIDLAWLEDNGVLTGYSNVFN